MSACPLRFTFTVYRGHTEPPLGRVGQKNEAKQHCPLIVDGLDMPSLGLLGKILKL